MNSETKKDALISSCGQYRYWLTRQWSDEPKLQIIMLNPSTADASVDDRTIGRCVKFAKREGNGGIAVMNLFAFRATSPADMKAAVDPVGMMNDHWIIKALRSSADHRRPILAAWGADGSYRARANYVIGMAQMHGAKLVCLGMTKDGHPRHPLYVKGTDPLIAFGSAKP